MVPRWKTKISITTKKEAMKKLLMSATFLALKLKTCYISLLNTKVSRKMETNLLLESGYTKLFDHYEKNKARPWEKWLEVKEVFKRSGRQGMVGLMKSKEDDSIIYVFKVSQYINYLIPHEFTVMQSLLKISSYCPHFCRPIGNIVCNTDPVSRKEGNPLELKSKYKVEKDVLLLEFIESRAKLYNYISNNVVSEDILFSCVKQVLLALSIAQKKEKFSHYDMHSNNVMIKKCNRELVMLYILDEENQFCVPTYGYYPVIIDFGFSYSKALEGKSLWPSLGHTEAGIMSTSFDCIADPKLFLVTVADEIHKSKESEKSKKLFNISLNVYKDLKIDWFSAWDNDADHSASDPIIELFSEIGQDCPLFQSYPHYALDIIQTLITLPLREQNYENFKLYFLTFLNEFIVIENHVGNPFFCLYILKGLVDTANVVQSDYKKTETRNKAVDFFRLSILEYIDSVVDYFDASKVHFERLLCSLLCLSSCIEGILCKEVKDRWKDKNKIYETVPFRSPEEIYTVVDINIPDGYVFTEQSSVMVIDCVNEKCDMFDLSEKSKDFLEILNNTTSICRGTELYRIFRKK